MRYIGWMGALMGLLPIVAAAQPDTVQWAPSDLQPIASFERATALAVGPSGTIYVTDAGQDAIVHLTAAGRVLGVFGGTGTEPGAFDDPADVAVVNGLELLVADAGNHRIQRFARDFRFLEALQLPASLDDLRAAPVFDTRVDALETPSQGTPVAVMAAPAGDVWAVDAARDVLVQWEARRRDVQVVGAFGSGAGQLADPVALAVDGQGFVHVADRQRDAVLTYDAFGSYVRGWADGQVAAARALHWQADRFWLVRAADVLVFDAHGRWTKQVRIAVEAPLVDATRHGTQAYVLTASTLYRVRAVD